MNTQTKIRIKKMREFLEGEKILEVGIEKNRITNGISLDCVKEYNPDILCDLNKEKIPRDNNSFDAVVMGEVLEHTINPYKVMREFHRILKQNGILILSVPNTCSFINRLNMLRGKLPTGCAMPSDDDSYEHHIVDFNKEKIIELLEKTGFKVELITSNGIITKGKLIFNKVPASFGETLILKARK